MTDRRLNDNAPRLALDEFLPYRLAVLAAGVSRALSTVYETRFGIGIAEWRIIANLGRDGNLEAGALAERSTLDKAKVTRALQRLQKRQLVTRETPRTDKRRAVISLTAKGRALFEDIATLALAWEAELLATLSAEDRRRLDRLIRELDERASVLAKRARD